MANGDDFRGGSPWGSPPKGGNGSRRGGPKPPSIDEVIEKIRKNNISIGHAKVLVSLDEKEAIELAKEIEEKNLSVRETEKIVKNRKKSQKKEKVINEELVEIGYKLKKLGFKIELGSDFLKIKFKNETDLEKLKKLLDDIN